MLTIGQLAAASGVPTSTIRFWERRDLIRPTTRAGGQRRYDQDALTQVGMLRLCQDAGFTLTEIREILDLPQADPTGWRELVQAKLDDVAQSMAKLRKTHDLLTHALECRHDDIRQCPDFQAAVAHRAMHDAPPDQLRARDRVTATGLPELAG